MYVTCPSPPEVSTWVRAEQPDRHERPIDETWTNGRKLNAVISAHMNRKFDGIVRSDANPAASKLRRKPHESKKSLPRDSMSPSRGRSTCCSATHDAKHWCPSFVSRCIGRMSRVTSAEHPKKKPSPAAVTLFSPCNSTRRREVQSAQNRGPRELTPVSPPSDRSVSAAQSERKCCPMAVICVGSGAERSTRVMLRQRYSMRSPSVGGSLGVGVPSLPEANVTAVALTDFSRRPPEVSVSTRTCVGPRAIKPSQCFESTMGCDRIGNQRCDASLTAPLP
mmetsp:Transcript_3530/g.10980  ORF Transcript_3530/g.10980 Transcript_3530/m.10980 type:complete len:279 (-) Transcript_3530:986-1822(-)